MTGAAASKVAPKSFNQIRNVAYIAAFLVGLSKGAVERTSNEVAWATHRNEQYKKNAESSHAHQQQHHDSHAPAKIVHPYEKKSETTAIEGMPVELVNLFKGQGH